MNAGVSLVQSYLALNGYLTVTEFPVIHGRAGGGYEELTDLDVLAVRLPHARHVIPRGKRGPEDDLLLEADPMLQPIRDGVDVIIGEVKEGRARLNDSARGHDVLFAALSRLGCVPDDALERVIVELQARGEATTGGALPARVRLVAFGDGAGGQRDGYLVVPLEEVARFVNRFLERYHHVLHPADLSDHVLGLLHLLRKLS